ncbi:MAG: peptidylprolyl isomerase [Gemmatales bacterium]|nr:peptidylprolyl isomerase [Gemmatales bacterium]
MARKRGKELTKRISKWLVGLGVVVAIAGCGEENERAGTLSSQERPGQIHPSAAASVSATNGATSGSAQERWSDEPAPWKNSALYAFLHQTLEEASQPVLPLGAQRPPDVTITGKSVGKIFEEVKRRWAEVTFATPSGTLRRPVAVLETECGDMEIALWPEVAPNHVRAFVALAESGYYDGLFFEMRLGERQQDQLPRAIGGGSPQANAQTAASIGLWLKPEILLPEQAKARGVRHQAGTVFCHWLGCFFYIGLNEAPMWDGEFVIFGEVQRNLGVAERIYDRLAEEADPPQIRRMIIRWHDTGKLLTDQR